MLTSAIVLLSLGLGAHALAVDADLIKVELDISDLTASVAVDGGLLDFVKIPQLENFNLTELNTTLGSSVYNIPEDGIDISPELYEALTGKKPDPLAKRQSNPCSGGTHRVWDLADSNWEKFLGNFKVMSSPLCGPGAISTTYSATYSYSISGSIDASFGPVESIFKGIGLSVGFAYTWGNAIATGYSATCDAAHPCIATFRPWIGSVKGRGRWTELTNGGNKLCASGYSGNVEIHLPIVRNCGDKECGADGVWDHCYYLGSIAKGMCRNIGPTPKPECAKSLYPH